MSTLPYEFYNFGSAVVYNNEIHILGGSYVDEGLESHYKWNGASWSSVSTLLYPYRQGAVVVWNSGGGNEIVILGTYPSGYRNYVAQWDGTEWTIGED